MFGRSWIYGYAAAPSFIGNPNATITAINTGGGIACSRTSGQVPCFIQVSLSAITATGTSWPYEDLDCYFNFGDPTGTKTFTNPGVGVGTINANVQRGPEAAYCYETAGTYTITCTIRGKNGGGYTTASVTQQIVVSAFDKSGGEYWVDSNAGGTNAGTQANPFNTVAAINAACATGGAKYFHVMAGSNFTGSTALLPWGSAPGPGLTTGIRFIKEGAGADPIFNITSGSSYAFWMINGGGASPAPQSDVVVRGIVFRVSGSATSLATAFVNGANNTTANLSDIYFDGCTFDHQVDTACKVVNLQVAENNTQLCTNYGLWNCTITNPTSNTSNDIGIYGSAKRWFFVIGGSITGAGSNAVLSHHIYPSTQDHSLYRWITFGSGPNRNYCIDTNYNSGSGSLEDAQYHCISENYLTGTERAYEGDQSLPVPPNPLLTNFKNYVAQLNNITGMRGDAVVTFPAVQTHTMRYNHFWGNTGSSTGAARLFAPAFTEGSNLIFKTYWNYFYISASATGGAISIGNASFTTWSQASQITDNIIQDMRATAEAIELPWASFPSNGATITRNQYYAPNSATYLYDNSTGKTLAAWNTQMGGTDTYGNPNWTDPANGVF